VLAAFLIIFIPLLIDEIKKFKISYFDILRARTESSDFFD
jgi:hypothetical protein